MRESNNCELRVCIEHAIIRTQYIEYAIYSASVHVTRGGENELSEACSAPSYSL